MNGSNVEFYLSQIANLLNEINQKLTTLEQANEKISEDVDELKMIYKVQNGFR